MMDRAKKSGILSKITALYIACMTSVYLLYPGFGGYERITEEKAALFFLLSGVYVGGMLLLRLELALVGESPWPKLRTVWREMGLPRKLVLAYWSFSVLSAVCSDFRAAAFLGSFRREGLITITLYCFSLLLVSYFARPGKWVLWIFAGAVSVNCVLALIQLAGYNPLGLYPQGMDYYDAFVLYSGQFLGTVGNVDLLSALLCVAIPIFWISLLKLEDTSRFFLLIPLGLCLTVLFTTFVAAGVLGVVVGALLTVPAVGSGRSRLICACAACALFAAGIAGVYFWGDRFGGFVNEAHQLIHGNWDDSFGSGRVYIWRKSLELVEGHLLLGGGPDTLGLRTDAVFQRYDASLGVLIRSRVDTAHSEYLNILVNQGLSALLAYLGALVSALSRWIKKAPTSPLAAACGGAVLCYGIQALFGISSLISAPYFWLAFALLLRALYPQEEIAKNAGRSS